MAEPATAPPPAPGRGRLDDRAVQGRLSRLEDLLDRVEGVPGPTAEAALDAVATLSEVYGEALARLVLRLDADGRAALLDDELLAHLFVLHGLHPAPVQERVAAALAEVRPYLASHGGGVELLGVDGEVARVRLTGSCQGCGASAATLEQAVTEAVLAAAPELRAVLPEAAPAAPAGGRALIPVEVVTRPRVAAPSPP
jgi:Fe-S cluster biogenesis protein NfuA